MKKERLTILAGKLKNKRYRIDDKLTIGRSSENIVNLKSLSVSRQHALIQKQVTGTTIEDLSSVNGTFVNGKKVKRQKLKSGDIIRIGDIEMKFEVLKKSLKESGHKMVEFQNATGKVNLKTKSVDLLLKTFLIGSGKKATIDELKKTQARLAAITEASLHISSERNLKKLFKIILDQVFKLTPAHNGVILIKNKHSGDLKAEYAKRGKASGKQKVSMTIVQCAFDKNEAVLTSDALDDTRFKDGRSIITQNISSVMCVPLCFQEERLGVIYVDTQGTTDAFDQEDLKLLAALSSSASAAIKNSLYLGELEKAFQDTLVITSNAIEMRDHYTIGHTWRVTRFALEIAKELGWNEKQLELCERGGVLHDVGKIAVGDSILGKPSKLTDQEFNIMRNHPERGASMMRDVASLKPLIPYCLYHHERWDGNGYPQGLKGEQIPVEGRVIAVADAFDAMTSKRPYKNVIESEKALNEIVRCKGTQFDPDIVDAFVACYEKGQIQPILQTYYSKEKRSIACPFCSTHFVFPDGAKSGDISKCTVCFRRILLKFRNNVWSGELVPESELLPEISQDK